MPLPSYEELTAAPAADALPSYEDLTALPSYDELTAEPDQLNAETSLALQTAQIGQQIATLPAEANMRARNDRERVFGMLRDQRDTITQLDAEAQAAAKAGDEQTAYGITELRKPAAEQKLAEMEQEAAQRFGPLRVGPEYGEEAVKRSITREGETPPAFQTAALTAFSGLESSAASALRHVGLDSAGDALAEDAQQSATVAKVAEGTSADIARGVGDIAALTLPGNPKGKLGILTMALRGAGAAETEALNNGATQEEAHKAALSTFPQLFAMLAAGGAAARGVEAGLNKFLPNASAATKGVAEFIGAAGANVGADMVMHELGDQPYGTRALTADVLFAALPGLHGYERARAEELIKQAKGEPNAVTDQIPARANGDVLNTERPLESTGALPPDESGTGVPPRGQGEELAASAPEAAPEEVTRNLGPGAANIEELQNRPLREIGAYNADVDARRAARGAEPLFSAAREAAPETWDKAVERVEQDPELPTRIITEINEGKRKSVTREDQTAILWKVIDLENRRLDAEEKAANPEMDPADREAYREEFSRLDNELNAAEEANRKAGTFSATALNIRRLIATENFTYARMLRRAELTKGEPLTEGEKGEIKKQSEGILRTENELAAKQPDSPEAKVDESIRAIEEEAKKNPQFTPEVMSLADRIVARLDKAADAALARLRSKFARASAGVDPTILIDVVTFGASKIAKGLVKFSQWSAAMVRDLGEDVKPYLEEAWTGANKHIDDRVNMAAPRQRQAVKEAVTKEKVVATADTIGEDIKTRVAAGEKISDLRATVRKLTETIVRGGIKGRDAVVDAVHERLQSVDPKITRRQTMDLMSGYGDFKKLNPDTVKAEVRDIAQQLQLVAKIEDVQAKVPLKKSGVERQTLSDESRRLTQELNENIKKLGVVVSDPASQLRTILAAQETRLTNRIKDLKAEIAAGERRVKTKTPLPTNEKIDALKKELAQVEAEHEKVLGKRVATEQQKVNAVKAALKKRNADLESRIAKGEFEPRKKAPRIDLSKDKEAVAAKAENERLKKDFAKKQFEWQQAQRGKLRKGVDFIKDVAGASRSLITSADLSAPFRQGGFLLIGDMVTNPARGLKQMGTMIRQFASESAFEKAQASLALRPNAELYKQSGLYFSDLDSKLSAREENMRSNLAEKIPLGIGKLVRASNRAYTGFLNRQRADAFDAIVESLGGKDAITPADAKLLAEAVNTFTGRGTAAGFERSANTLAKYFFSPRFLASRVQTLIGHPIAGQLGGGASHAVRRAIAKQYAKFGLGLAAIYGLAWLAGGKVDKDPRSSDFGKIRFGNTRTDPLTGLQQVLVLLTRAATRTQKVGGVVKPVTGDTFYRFARSKLAPIPGAALNYITRKNVVGEEVTGESTIKDLTVPMSYQDVGKIYKENGALRGTILEMLNLLGMGTSSYGKKN